MQRRIEVLTFVGRLAYELRKAGSGFKILGRSGNDVAHFLAYEILCVLYVGNDNYALFVSSRLEQFAVFAFGFYLDNHVRCFFHFLDVSYLAEAFGKARYVVLDIFGAHFYSVRSNFLGCAFKVELYFGNKAYFEFERKITGIFPVDIFLNLRQRLAEHCQVFGLDVLVQFALEQLIDLLCQYGYTVLLLYHACRNHSFAETRYIGVLTDVLK